MCLDGARRNRVAILTPEPGQIRMEWQRGVTSTHPALIEEHGSARLNKIAIQGAPQMAVDNGAISLSSVYFATTPFHNNIAEGNVTMHVGDLL